MKKTNSKSFIVVSIIFYVAAAALMAVGTFYDLEIGKRVFDPQSGFAISLEAFGQFVYWGMWGPLFSVLFLTRHSLQEAFDILSGILPFIKIKFNIKSKAYRVFNFIFKWGLGIGFFVLTVVGWRKLVANVLKYVVDWNEVIYYIISAVIAVLGIFLLSRLDKRVLKKLENLALAGVLIGIIYKVTEECKTVTHRIRIREMVAYSNGFVDEKGLSFGKLEKLTTRLTASMQENTDFSAFTSWFKIADKTSIYSSANSFPSGHTTYSCTIFMSALFCTAFDKLKKAAPYFTALSFVYVAAMGYSRMVAGAHYLTDVTAGAIIGYTAFIVCRTIYKKYCCAVAEK